jgi:hypothetical protein
VLAATRVQSGDWGAPQYLHVPARPIIKTVLRPHKLESAIRPHIMAVRNWAAVKLALR